MRAGTCHLSIVCEVAHNIVSRKIIERENEKQLCALSSVH